ncbi:MAG: vitamin B12 dependent-methionine synthase activation domain-containing protein [Candidatus Polarisedimenticolia bacterium]
MSDRAPVAEILEPLPIEVARPLVLLRLGYRRPSQVPEKTGRLLDEILDRGRTLLEPRAVLGEFGVEAAPPDRVVLAGTLSTRSRSLCERLAGCPTAVLFAATIGPALEDWGRTLLAEGSMTRSLLVDAYASAAAIALGMTVEGLAARRFGERGLAAGKRYAPGYGDWDLADQTPLCALLGIGRIGVEVTEDHLMIPAKSISGIIGGRVAG